MDNIIIGGIAMPCTRSLEIGGYYESKEAIMASGKTVRDVLGWRVELTASWEWVPAGLLAQLVPLVRGGVFVSIDYPDSTGATATGTFAVEIGSQKIFKFVDGEPMWYGVELTATAQTVIPASQGAQISRVV
ncbi:hypothetical protein [Intestinibacillus sp. Marseille-P6563]|uniref:hypothetical protein n=1 Tax=Intestinibacillus sp. Marseille-P6563 TaxID=2364792 RepID=UPI000F05AB34|nr:hypothetical protein [Intestinibacillus sp. Marseille-P6563]